jgi:hypothetical protein
VEQTIAVITWFCIAVQLSFNALFWVVAARRQRAAGTPLQAACDHPVEQRDRWLIVVPVLNEASLLRDTLQPLMRTLSDGPTQLFVALDGKTSDAVATCDSVVTELMESSCGFAGQRGDVDFDASSLLKDLEWEFVDKLLAQSDETGAAIVCEEWRRIAVIQRLPTSHVVDSASRSRRKAECLNLVLSLCGRLNVWLHYRDRDCLVSEVAIADLRERHAAVVNEHGEPIHQTLVSLSFPDIFFCVDADEIVDPERLRRFQAVVYENSDCALVQAIKYDAPREGTFASRAFSANYSSWFHWEGGWTSSRNATTECSYYGSLGALRLSLCPRSRSMLRLTTGRDLPCTVVFPEGHGVEDYPLFADGLLSRATMLVETRLAVGRAPTSFGALCSLWARWTSTNTQVFLWRTIPALCTQPGLKVTKRLALAYHGLSWLAYCVPGLTSTGIAMVVLAATNDHFWLGTVACVSMMCDASRRLLPGAEVRLSDRLLRVPIEYLLWGVASIAFVEGVRNRALMHTRRISAIATPREGSVTPCVVDAAPLYFLHGMILLAALVYVFRSTVHLSAVQLALLFYSAVYCAGALVLSLGCVSDGHDALDPEDATVSDNPYVPQPEGP